jgi:glycogen operon protein
MTRLYGSADLFPDDLADAYHPYQSINYVASHDGPTLYDLVAYTQRRNWANGHGNTDGPIEDFSWNCGWEGDENLPADVLGLRKRQIKNFCCLLFLANGVPMFRAGDEFMRSQGGNTNPYNQDNDTTWIDWSLQQANADVFRFFKRMIAFRKAHPSLCRSRFWRDDVHWYGLGPAVAFSPESRCLAFYLDGGSQCDDDLYVLINGSWSDQTFEIQTGSAEQWLQVVDTGLDSPDDFREPDEQQHLSAPRYTAGGRSVVVLRRPAASRPA